MRTYNFLILCLVAVAFSFTSCEQEYEKQYSWAYPVAGDWMVKAYIDGTPITGPWEMKTYNSSFGKDSIWIDDYDGNFWEYQVKCAVNMTGRTFQTNGSTNATPDYPIQIKILNGKVINNDSIYYEVQFEDDDPSFGTTYQIAGHREVSYEEYVQQ